MGNHNHTCRLCGVEYTSCNYCNTDASWRAVCDTSLHWQVYQVVVMLSRQEITAVEAVEKLGNVRFTKSDIDGVLPENAKFLLEAFDSVSKPSFDFMGIATELESQDVPEEKKRSQKKRDFKIST